tara:strand:+ start:188 stop:5755 length:5568 start_codon:yes stop_codon:yes gene_type:complete
LKQINHGKQTFKFGTNGLKFTIEDMTGDNPVITLFTNKEYTFERSGSGHPLRIVKKDDVTIVSQQDQPLIRSVIVPDAYNSLNDAEDDTTIVWKPTEEGIYYYTCTIPAHGTMIGKIIVHPEKEIDDDSTDYEYVKDKNSCDLDEANGFDFTSKGYVDARGEDITGYAYVMTDDYPYVITHYAGEPVDFTMTVETIPVNCPCVSEPLPKCGQNPDGSHFKYPCSDQQAPIGGVCSDGCKARCELCSTTDTNSISFSIDNYEFPSCEMNYDGTNTNNPCDVGKPDFKGICGDGCLQKCILCKPSDLVLCDKEQLSCKEDDEDPKCEGETSIANYKDKCSDDKIPLCTTTKCIPQCLERTCSTCSNTYSYLEFKTNENIIDSLQSTAIIKTNGMAIHPIEPYDTDTIGGWDDGKVDFSLMGYTDKDFVRNENSCPLCTTFHLPHHVEKGNTMWNIPPNSAIGISVITGVYLYNTVNKDSEIEFFLEGAALDKCMGYPAENCVYHYSAYPNCLTLPNCALFGYMYDGIPILANCSINGQELTSCYEKGSGLDEKIETNYEYAKTASCHLDKANGYAFTEQEVNDLNIGYIKNLFNNQINDPNKPFYAYIMNKNKPLYFPGFYGTIWGNKDRCPYKLANYTIEDECIEIKPICVDFVKKTDSCSCTANTDVCIETTEAKGIEYYKNSNIPQLSGYAFSNTNSNDIINSKSIVKFELTSNREINTENSAILIYFSSSGDTLTPMQYKTTEFLTSGGYKYTWEQNIHDINDHASHVMIEFLHVHDSSVVYDKLTNNPSVTFGSTTDGPIGKLKYENSCKKPSETSGYKLAGVCDFVSSTSKLKISECTINECQEQSDDGSGEINIECKEEDGTFIFSGCSPPCNLPTDTTKYNTEQCDTSGHAISEHNCQISCSENHYGNSPTASCQSGTFVLQGCNPKCLVTGAFSQLYYDISSCTEEDCTLVCQENYSGLPYTICPAAGELWQLDLAGSEGDTAIPCTPMCILPDAVPGYDISNVAIEETITDIQDNIIKKTTVHNLNNIQCEEGYKGTPVVSCTATDNEVFTFSGCTKACYMEELNTKTTIYDLTNCDYTDNELVIPDECIISCQPGYDACTPDVSTSIYPEGKSKCTTSNPDGRITLGSVCITPGTSMKSSHDCKPICTLSLTNPDNYKTDKCNSDTYNVAGTLYWNSPLTVDNCKLGCKENHVNPITGTTEYFELTCAAPDNDGAKTFDLQDNKCLKLCRVDVTEGYNINECTHYSSGMINKDTEETCVVECDVDYTREDVNSAPTATCVNGIMEFSGCVPKHCTNSLSEFNNCQDEFDCTTDICLAIDEDPCPDENDEANCRKGVEDINRPGCFHEYDDSVCDDGHTCTTTDKCRPYNTNANDKGCVHEKSNSICSNSAFPTCISDISCLPEAWSTQQECITATSGNDDSSCWKDEDSGCYGLINDDLCSASSNPCKNAVCNPKNNNAADGCLETDVVCAPRGDSGCGVGECIIDEGGCTWSADNTKCVDNVDCTEDICEADNDNNFICTHTPQDSFCVDKFDVTDIEIGCTVNKCDPVNNCVYTPSDVFCNALIGFASCSYGTCRGASGGPDVHNNQGCFYENKNDECNDDVSCTTDSCNPFSVNANRTSGCVNNYICDATLGDECTLELEIDEDGNILKPWSCGLSKTFSNCVYVQMTIRTRFNQIQTASDTEAETQYELLSTNDPTNPCIPNPCVGSGSKCIRVLEQEECTLNETTSEVSCVNATVNTYKCDCINGLTGTNCLLQSVKDSFDVPFEYTLYVVIAVAGVCVCNSIVIGGWDILKSCEKAAEKARERINKPAGAKYKRKQSDTNDIEQPLVSKVKMKKKKILHF